MTVFYIRDEIIVKENMEIAEWKLNIQDKRLLWYVIFFLDKKYNNVALIQ